MSNDIRQEGAYEEPPRGALRLTFKVAGGKARLAKSERLEMICPPQVGPPPEAGKHGGFWVEVRDPDGRVLFHRLLHVPLADSVETYSPDGSIERVERVPQKSTFEVLIPDYGEAVTLAFMGEYIDPVRAAEARAARAEGGFESMQDDGARELAQFVIPGGGEGEDEQ
jgi:hypothetical protein